jgi:DNA (cytosine-5)-methyltransferase 3A
MENGMNVLSLFDGMSCGRIALERAGIEVENYFASEIDHYAIKVSKVNYPQIKHIGSVTDVKAENLPKIDLLIGGSPCQGFSFAGKQLNFEDPRSKLFFEFVRLLKECKPKYFLLENVVMKKEFQDVISKEMGVEPILINSALASAQNRKRLYWTNIPGIIQPEDKGLLLRDIVESEVKIEKLRRSLELKDFSKSSICHHTANATDIRGNESIKRIYAESGKSPTLTTMGGGHREPKILCENIYWRKLTPLECERLQTVPENYTAHVSNSQRYKMLGNGWTIDVIAHIFKNIEAQK